MTCTEMVSAMGLKYSPEKSGELRLVSPEEKPVAMQIFGSDPDSMARAASVFGAAFDIIDINMVPLNRKEHIRRLAEVAHIMLDAGVILIVSAVELNATDLDVIQTSVSPELVSVVWVGNEHTTDIPIKLHLPENENLEASADAIRKSLSL